jgi:hypothetical protein
MRMPFHHRWYGCWRTRKLTDCDSTTLYFLSCLMIQMVKIDGCKAAQNAWKWSSRLSMIASKKVRWGKTLPRWDRWGSTPRLTVWPWCNTKEHEHRGRRQIVDYTWCSCTKWVERPRTLSKQEQWSWLSPPALKITA